MLISSGMSEAPMVSRSLVGIITLWSFITWIPPGLGQTNSPNIPTPSISSSQISRYAQAVLAIEPIRLKYYRQAQQMFSGDVPRNSCLSGTKTSTSPRLDSICQQYLRESMRILQRYDLTPEEFNTITQYLQADPTLYQRVQLEMMRYQNQ